MPNTADISPNIIFPLPEVPPPVAIKNALPEELFREVQDVLGDLDWGPESSSRYHSIASRWAQNVHFRPEIDDAMLSLAKKAFQDDELELAFYYTVRYQMHDGNIPYLWTHMDQNATQHTIDLCVIKHKLDDWGLYVDGQLFSEEENQAICMSSCQQSHGRPPYPSRDPEAYLVVLFGIYTKPGHWWRDLDGTEESFLEAIDKYRWDGDIRYSEYAGNAPYFDNIPPENKECQAYAPKECHECWTIPEEMLKEKIERNRKINGY